MSLWTAIEPNKSPQFKLLNHKKWRSNISIQKIKFLNSTKRAQDSEQFKNQAFSLFYKTDQSGASTARTILKKSAFAKISKQSEEKKLNKSKKKIKKSDMKKSSLNSKPKLNIKLQQLLGWYGVHPTITSIGSDANTSRNTSKIKGK